MAVEFQFVVTIREIITVLDLASRIRETVGRCAFILVSCVADCLHATLALVSLSFQKAFEQDNLFRDTHPIPARLL